MGRKTTGTLIERKGVKGTTWTLKYQLNGKTKKSTLYNEDGTKARTRKQAERARERIMAPLAYSDKRHTVENLVSQLSTIEDEAAKAGKRRGDLKLVEMWEKSPIAYSVAKKKKVLSATSIRQYRDVLRAFVKWATAKRLVYVSDVTDEMAQAYMDEVGTRVKPSTHNNRLLKLARYWDHLKVRVNPWTTCARLDESGQEPRFSEMPLEHALKAIQRNRHTEPEIAGAILIGAFTGMRISDVATLKWSDIDLQENTIQRVTKKTRTTVFFDLPREVKELTMELPQAYVDQPKRNAKPRVKADGDVYVFPWLAHQFLKLGCRTKLYSRMSKALSFDGRKHSFHDLRVTFITLCAKSGIPRSYVQEWVGHRSSDTTRIYERHHKARGGRQIAAAVSSAFRGERVDDRRAKLIQMIQEMPEEQLATLYDRIDALQLPQLEG